MLYDAFNRPVKEADLRSEHAGPLGWIRPSIFEPVAGTLTPDRLSSLLRAADEGDGIEFLTLCAEMEEREPHYASVLGTRKQAVAGLTLQVESVSDEKTDLQVADAVRELLRADAFSDLVDDLLDALGKGYSACEILWEKDASRWWPSSYVWRDPRWFIFSRETDIPHIREGASTPTMNPPGKPLPAFKFIVHYPRLRTGARLRGGIARLASVSYMCKSYTLRDWMAFLETYGHPLRIGRYGSSATKDDLAVLRRAVQSIGIDAAAMLPDSMRIEFEQPPNTTGGDKLFQGMADWLDRQISKAVLGQTMTTDSGSSRAQAEVHDGVRSDILQSDTKRLCATLNRDLVRPFVDLHFGTRRPGLYPKIYYPFGTSADIPTLADALSKLVPLGLRVEQSVIRDRLGIPDPEEDAELLASPTTAPALNSAQSAGRLRPSTPPEAADEIEQAALADWEQVMPDMLGPIEQAASDSASYEEFQERLLRLADELNPTKLTQALAMAMWKARGAGDAI